MDTISLNGPRRERAVVAGRRPTDPLPSNHPRHRSSRSLAVLSLLDWWDVIQSRREVSLEGNAAVQFSLKHSCPRDRMRCYHMTTLNPFTPSNRVLPTLNPLYFVGAVNVAGRVGDIAVLLKRYDTYTSH